MRKFTALVGVGVALAASARADLYWVSYEASGTFPEQEGWQRTTYAGGDERSFQDGALVLDGLASVDISDFYKMARETLPGPGETFRAEWRLCVDQVTGSFPFDPGICITSDWRAALTLVYGSASIYSLGEAVYIPFAPGAFHDYVLTSADLQTYALYIDGQLAHAGQFAPSGWESGLEWGDYGQGIASLSEWDYVRFGVVPEPSASLILGSAALALTWQGRGREV
jgi:hypothetical protein